MTTRYGRNALRSECAGIANAPEHQRNNTLSLAAGSMFQLVSGGEIDEADAMHELTRAAEAAGLASSEIRQTLDSARGYGARAPREKAHTHCCDLACCCAGTPERWLLQLSDATASRWFGGFPSLVRIEARQTYLMAGSQCYACFDAATDCTHDEETGITSWVLSSASHCGIDLLLALFGDPVREVLTAAHAARWH